MHCVCVRACILKTFILFYEKKWKRMLTQKKENNQRSQIVKENSKKHEKTDATKVFSLCNLIFFHRKLVGICVVIEDSA